MAAAATRGDNDRCQPTRRSRERQASRAGSSDGSAGPDRRLEAQIVIDQHAGGHEHRQPQRRAVALGGEEAETRRGGDKARAGKA